MRLTWQSKIESGSTIRPDVALSHSANRDLASRLALRTASRKALSPASGPSFSRSARSVIQPSPIASVMQPGQRRVGQQEPAPRRHAVGLVVEALRVHLGQVLDRHRAQQAGMDGGDAVRAVRADDREIGHPDLALGPLLDEVHALDAPLIGREAGPHLLEEPAVDLEDDLQLTRQQQLEPLERPLLQASGSSVWLVYASARRVRSHAWSHPRRASSSRMRISSATAIGGGCR